MAILSRLIRSRNSGKTSALSRARHALIRVVDGRPDVTRCRVPYCRRRSVGRGYDPALRLTRRSDEAAIFAGELAIRVMQASLIS
jgi:hypothetical protein